MTLTRHTSECTLYEGVQAGADDALVKAEDRHKPPAQMFHRDRVLRELMAAATVGYNAAVRDMLKAIRTYLEADVVKGPLGKAGAPKPPGFATPAQLERIREIVERYHARAVVELVGVSAVSPAALAELVREGLVPANAGASYGLNMIDQAYQYGRGLGGQLPGTDRERFQAATVTRWQESATFTPLNAVESAALTYSREQAGQYITALTDRVGADIVGLTVEQGDVLREQYRNEVEVGIAQRDAWRTVASRMGDETDDWSRDLQRVAATEMQQAHQNGIADTIRNDEGEDATVFKQPTPDACPDCIRLHLTGGPGSNPRLFKLSELEANGTNVGKKRKDWQAVVGTVHPWCFPSGTKVLTSRGEMSIEDVHVGTMVWTHRGHLRPVMAIAQRMYDGDLVTLEAFGRSVQATAEHPFLVDGLWLAAGRVRVGGQVMRCERDDRSVARYTHAYVTSASSRRWTGTVYNFSVHRDESYVANGLVVHNCACELHEMPDGWSFDEDGMMVPDMMLSLRGLDRDLMKSKLTMSNAVPENGMKIDVGDPEKYAAIAAVVGSTPPVLFDKRVGVTYITLDYPRPHANHLDCCDLAYWTGNEIRIAYDTPISSYPLVVRHELAHGLNVYIFNQFGGSKAVTDFHDALYARARREGFVTKYARTAPIENHAEVTRLFIWEQAFLRRSFPAQWALCHDAYKALFSGGMP